MEASNSPIPPEEKGAESVIQDATEEIWSYWKRCQSMYGPFYKNDIEDFISKHFKPYLEAITQKNESLELENKKQADQLLLIDVCALPDKDREYEEMKANLTSKLTACESERDIWKSQLKYIKDKHRDLHQAEIQCEENGIEYTGQVFDNSVICVFEVAEIEVASLSKPNQTSEEEVDGETHL